MSTEDHKKDRHFPKWLFDNFLRKLFGKPRIFNSKVTQNQVVADLGSGPGFHTFPLADTVGPDGRVYAVDSDQNAIQAVKRKAKKSAYKNVEAHVSSAARLDFIKDDSVDFVLANGLLC
jgi:ubiquinone/menaquinone biosynthesis C-methylase UbiE